MQNRKIDQKITKQVVIETELHRRIKLIATERSVSIKTLLEGYIADGLDKDGDVKIVEIRKPYKQRIISFRKE